MKFKQMLKLQKAYNDKLFKNNQNNLQKELITQNLVLSAHAELSSLIEAVNYRCHHKKNLEIDRTSILYESVDVIRYVMAIMNIWDIESEEFENAFAKKDNYLWMNKTIQSKKWNGEPVVIVDIDDVLAEFRQTFADWLEYKYNIKIDVQSNEYYFISELAQIDVNPERVFESFMSDGGFMALKPVLGAYEFLSNLRSKGYWIQLLTARPKDKLTCLYDTFSWLKKHNMPFDRLDFSTEKFRWCAQSEYYDSGSIAFAIDDSPKHASEYAKHGICVKVPIKSYNKSININNNVDYYENFEDLIKTIKEK